jgi:signal transduction histidine kinase
MNPDSSTTTVSQDTGKSRRRFKNFLFKPKYQISYGYYVVGSGFLFFGATALLIQRKMTQIDALLNQGAEVAVSYAQLTDLFADVTGTALLGFFGYVLFCSIYAVLISHRVAGPMTAIIGFIGQLQQGNYAYKRELRRHDELKPIHTALQRLATILRDKDG